MLRKYLLYLKVNQLLEMSSNKRYQWKGKLVSEKVYKLRLSQSQSGKNIAVNRQAKMKKTQESEIEKENRLTKPGEGRRIVELLGMAKQLWCISCKECLSLEYIESEQRRGIGSILQIRCHKCLLINQVTTGNQHSAEISQQRNARFDVNSKMALGKSK